MVPAQEQPEDMEIGMGTGTAGGRADTVDTVEKERRAEMGDTEEMVLHVKNTSKQLLRNYQK
jgi:hypothetical protein